MVLFTQGGSSSKRVMMVIRSSIKQQRAMMVLFTQGGKQQQGSDDGKTEQYQQQRVMMVLFTQGGNQCCGSGSKGSASFCRIRIHNIFHGSGSTRSSHLTTHLTLHLTPLFTVRQSGFAQSSSRARSHLRIHEPQIFIY